MKKYIVFIAILSTISHEGNFQIGGNILHPITLDDGHLDLLDYLSYFVNFVLD